MMNRRKFLGAAGTGGILLQTRRSAAQPPEAPQPEHPGVWKFRFGTPEKITPVATRHYPPAVAALADLPAVTTCPVNVSGSGSRRGYLVRIPLGPNEIVYGL